MSSFEKCLFSSFAHFLIKLFVFFLYICLGFLYIWDINPLSDTWLANIFIPNPQCCLVILLFPFMCTKFLFWCNLICLSLLLLLMLLGSNLKKKSLPRFIPHRYSPVFFLVVLQLQILCVSWLFKSYRYLVLFIMRK